MFVKPAPGLRVRDPETMRPIPVTGKEVPVTSFWLRRLAAGDVLASTEPDDVSLTIEHSTQEPTP